MIIKTTPQFDRSLKKYKHKHYDLTKLKIAVRAISYQDKQKLNELHDHQLVGSIYRELHVLSNWLLIYRIDQANNLVLILVNLGSHDDLSRMAWILIYF